MTSTAGSTKRAIAYGARQRASTAEQPSERETTARRRRGHHQQSSAPALSSRPRSSTSTRLAQRPPDTHYGRHAAAPSGSPDPSRCIGHRRRPCRPRSPSGWLSQSPKVSGALRRIAPAARRSHSWRAIVPRAPSWRCLWQHGSGPPRRCGRSDCHARERQRRPTLTIASTIHATRDGRSRPTDRARREPASRRSGTGAVSGARFSRMAQVRIVAAPSPNGGSYLCKVAGHGRDAALLPVVQRGGRG
jgi:hypothetical protein